MKAIKGSIPVLLTLTLLTYSLTSIESRIESESLTESRIVKIKSSESKLDRVARASRERLEYEFNMLKDPVSGKIPDGIREQELAEAKLIPTKEETTDNPSNLNVYEYFGPDNLGGRTRSVEFDRSDANGLRYLAGGISSGIFRTVNNGLSWTNVTPNDEIHSVSCIKQHTNSDSLNIWYYGTGELTGNSSTLASAVYHGHGIFKSVNNGQSWTKLPQTSSDTFRFDTEFDYVNNIAINRLNGYVYAACPKVIVRSKDGGSTWEKVLGNFDPNSNDTNLTGSISGYTDVVCTYDSGRVYAAFSGMNANTLDGVWTSPTGDLNSWVRIAGDASPPGWRAAGNYGRVVLAIPPSNQDKLYALYDNGWVNDCNIMFQQPEAYLFVYTKGTGNWENRSLNLPDEPGCSEGNDPFAVQGGYNLVISVKPDNENFVVIGGTNVYSSTDGFTSTANTKRIGGYANTGGYDTYLNHHPDIHALTFAHFDSKVLLTGTDGGVHLTLNVTAPTVTWFPRNDGYRTFQFYHTALSPKTGSRKAAGGAQDNGVTRTTTAPTQQEILAGDGCSVGLSSDEKFEYVSLPRSNPDVLYRRLSTSPPQFGTPIKPVTAGSNGLFVTYFHLDPDNTEHLYYADRWELYRTTNASQVTTAVGNGANQWRHMTGVGNELNYFITAMATTRGPYTANSKLYIGTAGGEIYRLNDPKNAAGGAVPVNIKGNILDSLGYVSSISVDPLNDRKVMVTFSSYNVVSIVYTDDAAAANVVWINAEGNLQSPSVRSSAIVNRSGGRVEYYVGTSVGLFSTTQLGVGTNWVREAPGPGNINFSVVSKLNLRPKDNGLLVGTHGNGMFFTKVPDPTTRLLELKLYVEGLYRTIIRKTHNDTVTVNLRKSANPNIVSGSAKGILDSNGTAIFEFDNMTDSTALYIQVLHRNALETWSSGLCSFTGSMASYDFSTSPSKAYGSNQVIVVTSPNVAAFYSGDVNQDGTVDAGDVAWIDNDAFNFLIGYAVSDLNGDSFTDATDISIADNNAYNFVSMISP